MPRFGEPVVAGVARVPMPNPVRMELSACHLESPLLEGHRAWLLCARVEQADSSPVYAGVRAVDGVSGHTTMAAAMLHAL